MQLPKTRIDALLQLAKQASGEDLLPYLDGYVIKGGGSVCLYSEGSFATYPLEVESCKSLSLRVDDDSNSVSWLCYPRSTSTLDAYRIKGVHSVTGKKLYEKDHGYNASLYNLAYEIVSVSESEDLPLLIADGIGYKDPEDKSGLKNYHTNEITRLVQILAKARLNFEG